MTKNIVYVRVLRTYIWHAASSSFAVKPAELDLLRRMLCKCATFVAHTAAAAAADVDDADADLPIEEVLSRAGGGGGGGRANLFPPGIIFAVGTRCKLTLA